MILLLLACTQGSIRVGPGAELDAPETEDDAETLPDADAMDEPDEEGCPSFYSADHVQELDLHIAPAEQAALDADYASGTKAYHPASLTWRSPDGTEELFPDVSVRLRGNPGFSWMGEKRQYTLSFNETDPDGRFHGQRKIALDAAWYNGSGMRNRLSYAYLRAAGIPAPCANHAFLWINGAAYGLYENIEYADQELLERLFGDDAAQGALWKYGSVVTANEEAADAEAMYAYWANPSVADQAAASNLDANIDEWAAEAVLPQNDGYWCCNHNFYVYEHPSAGLTFLPWDMDYSLDAAPYWADPTTWYRDSDWQPHYDAVLAEQRPRLVDAVRRAGEAYDADLLTAWLDAWEAQIAEYHLMDPTTPHSIGAHADGIAQIRAYLPAREAWIATWVDCESGETTDDDGDGYAACEECDGDDPTIHPGAVEVCNGRDDDCNGLTDDSSACDACQEFSWEGERLLMCPSPHTWAAARAICQSHGGDLGYPTSTGGAYVFWLSQYWDELAWRGVNLWWASASSCATVNPSSWAWAEAGCAEELPSVCHL